MKSMKDIMSELGFNKDAPIDAQKAFIKNLIAAANATAAPRPEPKPELIAPTKVAVKKSKKVAKEQHENQLSFDFDKLNRVS